MTEPLADGARETLKQAAQHPNEGTENPVKWSNKHECSVYRVKSADSMRITDVGSVKETSGRSEKEVAAARSHQHKQKSHAKINQYRRS